MSEALIVAHCSPTLAGLKTGNLFVSSYETSEQLLKEIYAFNRSLRHKGVVMQPLRIKEGKALLYLYRPRQLEQDLENQLTTSLLRRCGYRCGGVGRYLSQLRQRVSGQQEFPHEIGLFLGYPPEDVEGFIQHKGKQCKCVGFWKVYGDEEQAQRRFAQYRKCTRIYQELHSKGRSLDRLTVAM